MRVMAIIDIDSHILREICEYHRQTKELVAKVTKDLQVINDTCAKQEALMQHLVTLVKQANSGKGLENGSGNFCKPERHKV